MPDRTLDSAELRFDLDGPGGDPPQTIGPVSGDVEIIEVLALPPLGDAVAALGARGMARRRSGGAERDIAA